MLELAPYGLSGLVAILVVALCIACKDDSSSLINEAELCDPKGVERCTCAPDTGARQRVKNTRDL
jgi:hypothetical protein